MRFTHIELRNWKNFIKADVDLQRRVFIVGPNASGKSNFLEAFRFLRDLVVEGGGLAKAVEARGGMKKVRSLHQKGSNSNVKIRVDVEDDDGGMWNYDLEFNLATGKDVVPEVRSESVGRRAPGDSQIRVLFERPNEADRKDPRRLTQTSIQQISANADFRVLADFFASVLYLHVVPQLIREGQGMPQGTIGEDMLGRDLLDRMRATKPKTRNARLKRMQDVLKIAAPQFEELDLQVADERGRPHLKVKFAHWRNQGAYQDESQFSDGTLRLIGLLWALQEKAGPLLLEEPELSLHAALVTRLAPFIHRAQKAAGKRQVLLSTHSEHLLSDKGIQADEVLFVEPQKEGSRIVQGSTVPDIVTKMVRGHLTASEAILPRTNAPQMELFDTVTV